MMLKADLHIHTLKSADGFNTIYEIAKEAKRRKMEIIGITDHGPSAHDYSHKSYFLQYRRVPDELEGVKILFGAELNILSEEGDLDLPETAIQGLKIVSASLHKTNGMNIKDNTKAMLNAMKNKYLKVITHPGDQKFPVDIEKIAYEAIKRNILLEINASHFRYPHKMDEGYMTRIKKMIEICQENNHKMIIGSDAHILNEIGDDSALRESQKKLGFNDKYIINNSIQEVKEFFNIL